jgi:GGDEF domain-containing protein
MAGAKESKHTEWKIIDRLIGFVVSHFYRLKIARKLMLGYSVLLILLIGISVYALFNLNRLNELNNSILTSDLPVINTSEKMIQIILDQELYAQRYLILKTSDVLKLFWDKEKEFKQLTENIRSLPNHKDYPIDQIDSLHTEYNYTLSESLGWIQDPASPMAKSFEKKVKTQQEKMIAVIKGMAASALRDQNEKTDLTATIGKLAFEASAVLCGLGLLFSLTAAFVITRNISGALRELKYATSMISEGKFDHRPDIRNQDELGDLAQAFITMAGRLKQLEEMYLDTSPLTRLPGGVAIENVMNKRIAAGMPLAFCLMDIDNFKAYNDHYGYARGNDVIQATAGLIGEAVARYGNKDDFIGHIGGDRSIPDFYDEQDRQRGHIVGENRQGQEVKFPLATLSIAVVTNVKRKFDNHIQYGEVAAEMKELAKTVAGSVFLADQRGDDRGNGKKDRKLISLQEVKRESKG